MIPVLKQPYYRISSIHALLSLESFATFSFFLSFSGFFLHSRYLLTAFPVRACTSLNRLNRLADLEANRPISGHDKVVVLHSLSLSLLFKRRLSANGTADRSRRLLLLLPQQQQLSRISYRTKAASHDRLVTDPPSRSSLDISRIMKSRESSTTGEREPPPIVPSRCLPSLFPSWPCHPPASPPPSLPPFAAAPFEPIILLSECIRHNA